MKVRDFYTLALQAIGVLGALDPIGDDDLTTCTRVAAAMADTMNGDRLLLFTVSLVDFVLTPNQATNTIGAGASFNTTASLGAGSPRPVAIGDGARVLPVGETADYDLTPFRSREDYYREPIKTFTDQFPQRFLYEPTEPYGLLTWWPVPTTAATVRLPLAVPLTLPATPDTDLVFPQGYEEYYSLALARRLCLPYRKQWTPELRELYAEVRGIVVRNNDGGPSPIQMGWSGGGYDILTNRHRSA